MVSTVEWVVMVMPPPAVLEACTPSPEVTVSTPVSIVVRPDAAEVRTPVPCEVVIEPAVESTVIVPAPVVPPSRPTVLLTTPPLKAWTFTVPPVVSEMLPPPLLANMP